MSSAITASDHSSMCDPLNVFKVTLLLFLHIPGHCPTLVQVTHMGDAEGFIREEVLQTLLASIRWSSSV